MNTKTIQYTSALPAGRDFSIKITPEEPVYWEGYDEFRVTYQIEVIYLDQDRKLPFNEAVGKIKTLGDLDDLSETLLTRIKNILDQDNFFDIDSISISGRGLDLTQRKKNQGKLSFKNIEEEIKNKLKEKHEGKLFLPNEDYFIVDGFITQYIQEELPGIVIGGKTLPIVAVIGEKSGQICYFSLKNLLNKEIEQIPKYE